MYVERVNVVPWRRGVPRGHRLRKRNRRSWVRTSSGCKVLGLNTLKCCSL
jgi:hypothetical protein